MYRARPSGFTLIELTVVIFIIGLLFAAFAPDIFGMIGRGTKAANQANLKWHYSQLLEHNQRLKRLPKGSGHKFVLSPWVDRICERSEESFNRYFNPGLVAQDPTVTELRERGIENIWKSLGEVRSYDTHYAGRDLKQLPKGRLFGSDNEILMADDNQGYWSHDDGTIQMLMAGGSVREIQVLELEEQFGFDADGEEPFAVGPDSPHELLRKLRL